MPDEFDSDGLDSGNEDDVFDPSTADGSDADILGTDGSPSDDTVATPPDEEEESNPAGAFLDEGDKALLFQDVDRGFENIIEKANKWASAKNKTYTKRLQRAADSRKAIQPKVAGYDLIDQRLSEIRNSGPEGSAYVDQFLSLIKGEREVGSSGKKPQQSEPRTVAELMSSMKEMMTELVDSKLGNLEGRYTQDQATKTVDDFLKRANNPKITAIRDKLIDTMSRNPGMTPAQAIASADHKLYGDLIYEARRKREAPMGGARTVSEFTTKAAKPILRDLGDAVESAWAEHGGLPPVQ